MEEEYHHYHFITADVDDEGEGEQTPNTDSQGQVSSQQHSVFYLALIENTLVQSSLMDEKASLKSEEYSEWVNSSLWYHFRSLQLSIS